MQLNNFSCIHKFQNIRSPTHMRTAFLCLALLFLQCAKKVNDSNGTSVNVLNTKIEAELGSSVQRIYNSSKTYLLALRTKESTENFTSYLILEVKSGEIIKKGSFIPGHIQWIDDTSLELLNAPGIIPQGKSLADYKTVISLEKK